MTPSKTSSHSASPERCRGLVARILPERGYGFIRAQDGAHKGEDFFFHANALQNCAMADLHEGLLVSFEPTEVPRGLRAEQIELLRKEAVR